MTNYIFNCLFEILSVDQDKQGIFYLLDEVYSAMNK